MTRLKTWLCLSATLLLSAHAAAVGVNPKNGNFYITYSDLTLSKPGYPDLELDRTYNNKSVHRGWFGYGWGSGYEDKLERLPDGSYMLTENGSGMERRFMAPDAIREEALNHLVKAAARKDTLDAAAAAALKKRLLGNEAARRELMTRLSLPLPPSRPFQVEEAGGISTLVVAANGTMTVTDPEKARHFDAQGRLLTEKNNKGYAVTLNYGAHGRPDSLQDSVGRRLRFAWDEKGFLVRVQGRPSRWGKAVQARYEIANNEVVHSIDSENNVYRYTYDSRYNMTRIDYANGSKLTATYDPKTQSATSYTQPDGTVNRFDYRFDSQDPENHYWTDMTVTDANGASASRTLEFRLGKREDGSETLGQVSTSQRPSEESTTRLFDNQGRMQVKRSQNPDAQGKYRTVWLVQYRDTGAKPVETRQYAHLGQAEVEAYRQNGRWPEAASTGQWRFEYDTQQRLTHLDKQSPKERDQEVRMDYDRTGNISHVRFAKIGLSYTFRYDARNRMTEVLNQEGMGLRFDYDREDKVDVVAPDGHKLGVMSDFMHMVALFREVKEAAEMKMLGALAD